MDHNEEELLNVSTEPIEEQDDVTTSNGETVESLRAERDGLVDQLQRSVAEFQNYRRRVEADRFRLKDLATQDFIKSVLPLIDDLQRAIGVMPDEQRTSGLGEGIVAIERKFLSTLERNNVVPVGAVGEQFDPAFHEAVATDDSGEQTHIVEVYQTGYRQGDSVLRPAMVKVGAATVMNA
ncbi:MAG: nucleotide exchange factor GrpE [Chloroflexota bacterium]|jgi:molecular chaperone GrpE|nr:nucleotide exchange factor GrpE [Chloroflexota bacterium]